MSRVSEGLLQWAAHSGDESGCTAVMAVAVDDSYLVAHVGDSKALLCQQKPGKGTHALWMLCQGARMMHCLSGEAHVGPTRVLAPMLEGNAYKAESDLLYSHTKPACFLPPRQQQPRLCKSCRLAQGMCLLWSSPGITAQAETMSEPESWRQEAL